MNFFSKHSFAPQHCRRSRLTGGPLSAGAALVSALLCLLPALLQAQSPAPAPAVAAEPAPPADARPETVISSDELDMVGGEESNHFYFRGNVKVQATNMLATCDELEVISARKSVPKTEDQSAAPETPAPAGSGAVAAAKAAATPDIGSIREIVMRGNVVISQEGRRATAGIAYLYPQEGRVVLAEGPLVTDAQGTLSGWRMELYRGERKVRILSNPDETQRTRVTLPALQDLGYGELGGTEPNAAAPASAEAAPGTGKPAPAAQPEKSAEASPRSSEPAPKKDESGDSAKPRRSGGWNPVNAPGR